MTDLIRITFHTHTNKHTNYHMSKQLGFNGTEQTMLHCSKPISFYIHTLYILNTSPYTRLG